MRSRILGSVGALLAAAPLSLADAPPQTPAAPKAISNSIAGAPLANTPSVLPQTSDIPDLQQPPQQPAQQPPQQPAQQQPQQQPTDSACSTQQPPKVEWRDCHCGPREQIWFGANYRNAWIKDAPMPYPLLTTGPASSGGFPGTPGTVNLFGGQPIDYGTFSGLDANIGMWLNCRHTIGLEFAGFYLFEESQTASFRSNAAGTPFLARPIFDGLKLTPNALLVSSPGILRGDISFRSTAHAGGGEANIIRNLFHCDNYTIDTYYGFRYIELDETFDVAQTSVPIGRGNSLFLGGNQLPAGVGIGLTDRFSTTNEFYGGQVGTRGEVRFGPAFLSMYSALALGPNREDIRIDGRTVGLGAGGSFVGGLLAVGGGTETILAPNGTPTAFVPRGNIGRSVTTRFTCASDIGVQGGVYVTSHVKFLLGYSWLYMTDVARPGTQIDTLINPKLVPSSPTFGTKSGFPNPQITGRREDFSIQSLQFGMEMKF